MLNFNSISVIYKDRVIGKKNKIVKMAPKTIAARARQRDIVKLVKGRLMGTKAIARELGAEWRTVKGDVRSLVERGEIINLSSNKQAYLVRAA